MLVAIIKTRLNLDASRCTLRQILSVTLFEEMPLQRAFPDNDYNSENVMLCQKSNLFES